MGSEKFDSFAEVVLDQSTLTSFLSLSNPPLTLHGATQEPSPSPLANLGQQDSTYSTNIDEK